MAKRSFATIFLTTTVLGMTGPAKSAEVTADRLINADKEPQNWLINHRTYDAQRFSPLDRINKSNVKGLKLAYAVALGGTSANANLKSTPLAEDGFLYVVDQWGVLYKIDGRSGDLGRNSLAHGSWSGEAASRQSRCGVVGQFRRHSGELSTPRDRNGQGDRQSRLGEQSRRRASRSTAHRRAARRKGQDRARGGWWRPRGPRFHGGT